MFKKKWIIVAIASTSATVLMFLLLEALTRIEVERDFFKEFKVREYVRGQDRHLKISGSVVSSTAADLSHVSQTQAGDTITIHVFVEGEPFRIVRMLTGDDRPLDLDLTLSPNTHRVLMGCHQAEIWPTDNFPPKDMGK